MQELTRDVVIVGAGPAGLSAARRLVAEGKSVAVLEARDRVGGRTWSKVIDGSFFEIGGQWISPDQTALLQLVEDLGKETFTRYREGKSLHIGPDGTRTEYEGSDFPIAPDAQEAMNTLIAKLTELSAEIDPAAPWDHPRAEELDSIQFSNWLREIAPNEEAAVNVAHFVAGGMLTKRACDFSVLQAMLMAASAGGFENLVDEDFILDKRVVGGMQSVSEAMAAELGDDVVILDSPVRFLEWEENGPGNAASVTATTDNTIVRAQHAILAVPPNLYSRIQYVPALPRTQMIAHQHQSMGLVIKVHAAYDRPFWREQGLSGTCFAMGRLIPEVYDNSNHEDERGTLVGFIVDKDAEAMWALSDEERKRTILEGLAEFFGEEALNPVSFYLSDWGAEEWTRGAYACSYDLGGLHRWGGMQNDAVGPIFFASSDIQGIGYQHVDGAVRIGTDTANRILAAN